jgi:hypothetical protein
MHQSLGIFVPTWDFRGPAAPSDKQGVFVHAGQTSLGDHERPSTGADVVVRGCTPQTLPAAQHTLLSQVADRKQR